MTHNVEIITRAATVEIHLNRSEKKNAITTAMYTAMSDAMAAAEADRAVRTILFAGHGAAFSAGNDLQDFLSTPMTEASPPSATYVHDPLPATVWITPPGLTTRDRKSVV